MPQQVLLISKACVADTGTHADSLLQAPGQALPDQAPGNQAVPQVAMPSVGKLATSNAQCAQPPEPSRPTLQEPEDPNSEARPPGLAPEQQGRPVSASAAGLQLPHETVTKLRSTLSHPSSLKLGCAALQHSENRVLLH